MKPLNFIYLGVCSLFVGLTSCGDLHHGNNDDTHTIGSSLTSFFDATDSLSEVFHEKDFQQMVDTFKISGREEPKQISIIESYFGSAYSITNVKWVL